MLCFPWKHNRRLSCACLSVFLVTGHLSLFPFWTTSYLLTYSPTLQCASAWTSRWCRSARGRGRTLLAYSMWIYFWLSVFVGLFFSVITLALLYCYSKMMCTQFFLSVFLHPQGASVLFIFQCFCLFLLSLLIVSCCTTVSDVVMYAPHVFDPSPRSPVLCTLHNHPLQSLEVYLNSLSYPLSPSHTLIPLFLNPPPSFFGCSPGHHSFPPSSFSSIPDLESWRSCSPLLTYLLTLCTCIFLCSLLAIAAPLVFLYFPSSPSPCLLLSTLPVVSLSVKEAVWCVYVCMCVCLFSQAKSHLTEHATCTSRGPGSIITTKLSQTVYKVASCCRVVGEHRALS